MKSLPRIQTAVVALGLVVSLLFSASSFADASAVQKLLSSPDRSEADRARDQRDKTAELIAFFNVSKGDKVVDVFAGGGYWSEVFAAAVGQSGQVLVHNNEAYKKFVGPNVHLRFQDKPLPQIALYDREVTDLGLAEASQNVIYMGMSFHDLYFVDAESWPAIDSDAFIAQLHAALVDGGRLIIVDHAAKAGTGAAAAQDLHRIEKDFVIQTLEARGFRLAEQSALLANATDSLEASVFDKSVRGQTNRFILVFVKG
ncbi:hypothetical protein QWY82_08590 [Simiduia curdlanivorans]|uniref:Methyltransferase n=1 Tax=Simiduia curdlanivorans TaxID=1492769 RepID=A0ABV8V7P4_9GAMM|nr:hypothetical protein [Simiduia curdlanivorans]MDN3638861.1 hypothetical protein [Simiduia curdlanivorans]